ncbi:MAG: TonB-dependent receptor [Bacteroidota bacterium]
MNRLKMKIKTILFFSLILSSFNHSFAQSTIKGFVSDGEEALAFCNVSLLHQDSTLLHGTVSDIDGKFEVNVSNDQYILKITYVGFEEYSRALKVEDNLDLGEIVLQTNGAVLNEVTVSVKRRLIERKTDRLVFNLSQSIAAQGSDMSRAISLAPGILVQNNRINLVGRGEVRVLINGRLLQLEGEELMAYLSTISSDDVEKVEIITNPPAEYDAAGNTGFVNIVFKKGRNNSWRNNTVLSYTQNRNSFASLRNSLLYNKEQHSLAFSLNGTKGSSWNTEYGTTFFPDFTQDWEAIYITNQDQFGGRLAYDYQINDNNSIGFQYQGSLAHPSSQQNTVTDFLFSNSTLDTTFINDNTDNRLRENHAANLHFSTKLDSLGKQLSIDADYFSYRQTSENRFDIQSFSKEEEYLGLSRSRNVFSDQRIQNYSFKVDMVHPIEKGKLTYGAKYNLNISDNGIENYNLLSGESILDKTLSNTFEYEEGIAALYLSGSRQLSSKWNVQLGARLEHTKASGFSATLNQRNDSQFTRLFPTAYLQYNQNDNHQYTWSVGGRINRASFRDLNPFRIYITNNAYSEGNPFLLPSYSYNFNFNHVFKGKFTTNFYYSRQINGFGTLFLPFPEEGVLATIRDNFFDGNYLGIGEIFPIDINEKWSMQNQAYLMYNHTKVYDSYDAKAQNGFQYYLSSNQNFILTNGWKIQVNMWYNSAWRSNIFKSKDQWQIDIGLQKKFLNDQLQFSLQINDLFDTASLEALSSEINGILNTYGQNYSNRNIQVSLSYQFGNEQVKVKHRGFGNEDVRGRL